MTSQIPDPNSDPLSDFTDDFGLDADFPDSFDDLEPAELPPPQISEPSEEEAIPVPEVAPPAAEASPPTAEAVEADMDPELSFGWTTYAEQLNGRFAMVGIILLLLLELFSNQTFFQWIGLR